MNPLASDLTLREDKIMEPDVNSLLLICSSYTQLFWTVVTKWSSRNKHDIAVFFLRTWYVYLASVHFPTTP